MSEENQKETLGNMIRQMDQGILSFFEELDIFQMKVNKDHVVCLNEPNELDKPNKLIVH